LPTFLDAASLSIPDAVEGRSLLDVLRGKPWRTMLDLEHASCYAPKDGWVALMDARYKYVYYTITGEQQLFDLRKDPQELRDLAAEPAAAKRVREWRQKMVAHLAPRGDAWVRDGDLVVQRKAALRRADAPLVVR
jgi:arylsulfatase A-like enzyme